MTYESDQLTFSLLLSLSNFQRGYHSSSWSPIVKEFDPKKVNPRTVDSPGIDLTKRSLANHCEK